MANSLSTSANERLAANLFDAHTHLHDARIASVRSELLRTARAAGVAHYAVCGTSPKDWEAVAQLTSHDPSAYPAFGVHPWFAGHLPVDWLERLEATMRAHPQAAVGEVGLDAVRQSPDSATQMRIFEAQIALAIRIERPIILHAVRCVPEILRKLRSAAHKLPGFMIHFFSGSVETLRELEALGGYASFGGALLNPHASRVLAAARVVSPEHMLVETDSPDALPKGGLACGEKRDLNHPANLTLVVDALATLRSESPADISGQTSQNALRFWSFPH